LKESIILHACVHACIGMKVAPF